MVFVLLLVYISAVTIYGMLKVMNFHGVLAKFHEKNRLISFSSSQTRASVCSSLAFRACLLGALAKLPGPGSELRRPILVAWGQDRCLGGVLPGRAASKQALSA